MINETARDMAYFRSVDCGGWTDWKGVRGEDKTFFDLASTMDIARCLKAGKAVEARDDVGATPLHKAVLNNNAEAVEALIDANADLEATWAELNYGTSLHLAAGGGFTNLVSILVSYGGKLEAVDEWGRTPLHSAAGAARRSGTYSTSVMARSHAVENIKALVAAGAMLEARNIAGRTALHEVVENIAGTEDDRHDDVDETLVVAEAIDAFVAAGSDLEAGDKGGRTPLHLAARNNSFETAVAIETLLGKGANIASRDVLGKTPLHLAAEFDAHKKRKIRRCTTSGVGAGRTTCDTRMRPFASVHVRNATAAIHVLLNAGAETGAGTKNGKTPFELVSDDSPIRGTEAYRRLEEGSCPVGC